MFDIPKAIESVSNLGSTIITRIWPDANETERAKATALLAEMQNEYNLVIGQIDVNKIEAASPSWFVAGARPAAMWVGVISLAYSGIGISLGTWLALCFGLPPLPLIDPVTATNLLTGLLGLGTLRTVEKVKDVATKRVGK